MDSSLNSLEMIAADAVENVLGALPAAMRAQARAVPVTFQGTPNAAQCEDGIEPDTLGLFIGPEFSEEENCAVPLPPQIILFLENLWEFSEQDEAIFREEVRTTLLHELGHYLGLDEDDLFERGLE